jgi:hypothetical protein
MLTSGVGIPVLLFFSYLSFTGSKMLASPTPQEQGKGCVMAAVMYGLTFAGCYIYLQRPTKAASAREVPLTKETQMQDGPYLRS